MKKKTMLLMSLLLMLVMVLAACGGTADDEVENAAEGAATEVTDAAEGAAEAVDDAVAEGEEAMDDAAAEGEEAMDDAAAEGEEAMDDAAAEGEEAMEMVERPEGGLLIWSDELRTELTNEIGEKFTEETGVPVAVQQIGFGDIRDQLKLSGPAGEGPDIIVGAHDWLGELVVNGLVSEMDLGAVADQLTENSINAFTYNGTVYGLPTNTENVALLRNTDLVPDAPETWDDVMDICAELGDQVEQCFAHIVGDPYHFYPIQSAYGGAVFGRTDDGSYDGTQVEIDSEGSIAGAQALEAMVEAGYVGTDVDWDTAHALFEDGKSAFIITGPWALERIGESGVPYAVGPIPAAVQPGQPFLGAQGFLISAFSEEQALAQSFLTEYIATEEVMQAIAEGTGRPSAMQSVLDAQIADSSDQQGFAEAGANAVPMPAIPEMASVWAAWGDAITLIVNGEADATTAFQNAAEQIRTAIGGS
ncbi:MAG: maltose ABC transporter substrate-binding protein [Ardenticatenales bacterium]|nr:maltose ABC transporter substrate-binding protein [Ardenticatenales bacterium]